MTPIFIPQLIFFQPKIFHIPPTATTASLEELVDFLCIHDLIWLNSARNMEFEHPAIAVSLDELCPIILHFDPHKLSAAKGQLVSPLGELVKQKPVIVSDGLYPKRMHFICVIVIANYITHGP